MTRRALALDSYVIETLMPDLIGHDKRPAAFVVYLWLWSKTRGVGTRTAFLSYQMLADGTGLSKTTAQRAIRWLERRELVRAQRKSPTATPGYTVLAPWNRSAS